MAIALGPIKAAVHVRRHERAALKELQRRYDAFQQAHKAKRKALGLTALDDAVGAAHLANTDALLGLFDKLPVTVEGRKALAAHLQGLSPADAPWWAMRKVLRLLAR